MDLRDYQFDGAARIHAAWQAGAKTVLYVLDCGGGKTPVVSECIRREPGNSIFIAHRDTLIIQASMTLARNGLRHRITASTQTIRECVAAHMRAFGRSFYDANAKCAVASVDTLRVREPDSWDARVRLAVTDEGHHVVRDNKWEKVLRRYPNARMLLVTATPVRADGKGLGRHADGIVDVMIEGPQCQELINRGFLADFDVYAPQSDIDFASVPVSASTGDFSAAPLVAATRDSSIVGDIVKAYLKIAPGKRCATFMPSVDLCVEQAARFRAAGVPAEVLSAHTPHRAEIIRRFEAGDILQLVTVDILGEGWDCTAAEVVADGAATHSLSRYKQRSMRPMRPKTNGSRAILIDHVGNWHRNGGPPNVSRVWTLDRRDRRAKQAERTISLRACAECTRVYERPLAACPFCGHTPIPVSRASPALVEGDLTQLDPAVLARLYAAADPPIKIPYGATPAIEGRLRRVYHERSSAQRDLRSAIAWWAGRQRAQGRSDPESYRRFWLTFGVDVATAKTLNATEAAELMARIGGAT